jgi:hypothetical protein
LRTRFVARALARCVSLTRFRCSQSLDKIEMVTLPSGLQYRDIVVGSGPNPQPGYQARARRLATAPHARPVPTPTARARAPRAHPGRSPHGALRTQAVVDYVAMTAEGRIFENSLANGKARSCVPLCWRVSPHNPVPRADTRAASNSRSTSASSRATATTPPTPSPA